MAAQGPVDLDLVDEEVARLVLAWGVALGAPDEVTQGPATMPLRYLADWVARRFGFVAVFFREVATYLADGPATGGTHNPR